MWSHSALQSWFTKAALGSDRVPTAMVHVKEVGQQHTVHQGSKEPPHPW